MNRKLTKLFCSCAVLSMTASSAYALPTHTNGNASQQLNSALSGSSQEGNGDIRPTGKGIGDEFAPRLPRVPNDKLNSVVNKGKPSNPPGKGNGIYFHGGPVMSATISQNKTVYVTPKVWVIYYGDWTSNQNLQVKDIIGNLLGGSNGTNGLGGSPYFNINTSYTNAKGDAIRNGLQYMGAVVDSYSQGQDLTDTTIQQVLFKALSSGKTPYDPNTIYMIVTSQDVNETGGFCSSYCAWHGFTYYQDPVDHITKPVIYGFVGDPARCPNACEALTSVSPNNNPSADGIADSISHEIEESITDPYINAWYDHRGAENADKCVWNYGPSQTLPNGAPYNMTINNRNYYIQQNWVNANGGYCAQSY